MRIRTLAREDGTLHEVEADSRSPEARFTDDQLQAVYEMDIVDAAGQRLGTFPPTEDEALTIAMLLRLAVSGCELEN